MKASELSRRRSWLRLLFVGLVVGAFLHACGGAEFSSDGTNQSLGSDASAGGAGSRPCLGPEDCDDNDPCTIERCKATGLCEYGPTCGVGEQCCEGRCGECCADSDCDDGVGCTVDRCFLGACIAMADDGACSNATVEMYCSTLGDCRAREPCPDNTSAECEDGDSCTTDVCIAGLCSHDPCAEGSLCCPEFGCSECCTDSQCDDNDPCTVDSCSAGSCSNTALCGENDLCCADPMGTSASCGQCCSQEDCNDDVDCTVDSCVQGQCDNSLNSSECPPDQICTPEGCSVPQQCDNPTDCVSNNPCLTGTCEAGHCQFSECDDGLLCCPGGCKECCGNPDCDDQDACTNDVCENGQCSHTAVDCPRCDSELGCLECENESDCDDGNDCTTDSCNLETYTCNHEGGACGTERCCGLACQECCSPNDCVNAATEEGVLPGLPCVNCDNGKCGSIQYCAESEICCAGECVRADQLCNPL